MNDFERARARARQAVHWGAATLARQRKQSAFIKANGLYPNYFVKLRDNENPPHSAIQALADWFNMGLEEFIEEAWAHRDDDDEETDTFSDPKIPPEIGLAALLRASRTNSQSGDIEMAETLRILDEERFCEPMLALIGLQNTIDDLPGEQIPYALQIAASCYRTLLDFKEAAYLLRIAQNMTEVSGNRLAFGDNLRRWVYLLGSAGYRKSALDKNQASFVVFSSAKSFGKIGEVLVDQGYCLHYLDRFEESVQSHQDALGYSSYLNRRHQAGARQGAALSFLQLGRLDRAKALCLDAIQIFPENGQLVGTSQWTLAKIHDAMGKPSDENYEASIIAFRKSSPIDAMIVFIELCIHELKKGTPPQFVHFPDLMKPLSAVPELEDSLLDTLADYEFGRLKVDDLERTMKKIKRCRPLVMKARTCRAAIFSEG